MKDCGSVWAFLEDLFTHPPPFPLPPKWHFHWNSRCPCLEDHRPKPPKFRRPRPQLLGFTLFGFLRNPKAPKWTRTPPKTRDGACWDSLTLTYTIQLYSPLWVKLQADCLSLNQFSIAIPESWSGARKPLAMRQQAGLLLSPSQQKPEKSSAVCTCAHVCIHNLV